ncbi:MAG: PilW family protein [Gammaproteobacteria bacterium]|nr:PilW family protein [Gammaproteobacteria bacterium]
MRTARRPDRRAATAQRGMTLIELTVAMAIGLFLIGGALYVYSQSKNTYRASDSLARLQETARFALDTLEPDIRLARYWGLNSEPALIDDGGLVATCDGAAANWALEDLSAAVEARDDGFDLPGCASFNDAPRDGSDVLILRHAEPWQANVEPLAEANRVPVQTTLAEGRLFNDGIEPLGPDASTHNVTVNAYYVSNESSFDPALPSLRRLTLGPTGDFDDQEVIPGVENLQVQLGVDTDRDGDVDRYVDGDHPLVTFGAAGFDPDGQVVAVRIWLLVATPADDRAWVDDRRYATPDADLGDLVAGSDGYPSTSRRLQISKTIFLNNEGA